MAWWQALLVLFLIAILAQNTESSKKTQVRPAHRPVHWKLYWKSSAWRQWPKVKNRCSQSKPWDVDGIDILKRETEMGKTVLLFLAKKTCSYCMWQLESLNNLAHFYNQHKMNVSVVVINHKRNLIPNEARTLFKNIQIYQERKDQDIFKQVGGTYRDVFIYDKCRRQQFRLGYPFSWLGHTFVRTAVHNALNFPQMMCGECPTVKPSVVSESPTNSREITDINGPLLETKK